MIFTKVWAVFLAVVLVVAFGMAVVAPRPMLHELSRSQAQNLDRAQHNAELMLRLETRDWIDTVAKISRDRVVVNVMDRACNRAGGLDQIKAKMQGRLLTLVSMLNADTRPELVIAVDNHGKQVFRMGPGEESYIPGRSGLIGYPLVDSALRGYRRDDTWNIDGKLYLMAASPIISKAKMKYVGALILGEAINDAFARRFKAHLDRTDVAFFMRGKTMGSTVRSQAIDALPTRYSKEDRRKEIKQQGRTAALLVGKETDRHFVIMTPLPGVAGIHDAFYAVIDKPAASIGLFEALGRATSNDLSWSQFPWLLLFGLLLVAAAAGVALTIWEVTLPLRKLEDELRVLTKGDIDRLDSRNYAKGLEPLVVCINRCIDNRTLKHDQPSSYGPRRNAGPIIADLESSPTVGPEISVSTSAMPPMATLDNSGAEKMDLLGMHESPTSEEGEIGPGVRPLMGLEITETPQQAQPALPNQDERDPYDTVIDPPRDDPPAPSYESSMSDMVSAPRIVDGVDTAMSPFPAFPAADSPDVNTTAETLISSVPESMAQAAEKEEGEDLQEYMQQVYTEFLTVKQQCGEDTSNLTFARFSKKLQKNRELLIDRYACRSVRFQVYIKDGKAALKATPVKK